jgi:isopentenyl-diphosphate delta-isomerase
MSIQKRKKEHVDLTAKGDVEYAQQTGFEQFMFKHNALPELDSKSVKLEAEFLGRAFSFPLFISSMTGGYSEAGAVNTIIAEFCERNNLPFGVGSQRAMLEDPNQVESFSVVRKVAPQAFIAANIGGAQLIDGLGDEKIELLIESIDANAAIIHLNPLQELMQPEGDHDFAGIEEGIKDLISKVDCPVIVKETGAGISCDVARRLLEMGVSVIDVAGAGGTSWSKVENLRERTDEPLHQFNDWGIPTVYCIRTVNELKKSYDFELIASGGIRSSFDIAKSLALGADFTATAQPVIQAIVNGGYDALEKLYQSWRKEMQIILTLTGSDSVEMLSASNLIEL